MLNIQYVGFYVKNARILDFLYFEIKLKRFSDNKWDTSDKQTTYEQWHQLERSL